MSKRSEQPTASHSGKTLWRAGRLDMWWLTALWGVITIGFGNGALAYSEQWMPSGLAALMVCVQPFWPPRQLVNPCAHGVLGF